MAKKPSLPGAVRPTATALADPPAAATKAEPATPAAVPASALDVSEGEIAEIGAEAERLSHAAENIFCRLADGATLSDGELAVLRRVGPAVVPRDNGRSARAFDRWLHTETSRIKAVRQLQAKAGSAAERQAALEAASAAEATLAARSQEIDQAIARLQTERSELTAAASTARTASDHRQAALRKLRQSSILPPFVADRLQQFERRWSAGDGHRLEAARNRLSVLEGLAALDVSQRKMVPGGYSGGKDLATVASYVEGLADFGPDPYSRLRAFGLLRETTRPPYGSQIEVTPDSLDRLAWKAYLDGPVAAEIEKLRREIARLETAETEHFKTMATMVDYYVPG